MLHHQFLAVREGSGNDSHHIYNNNGTLFLHFMAHPTALTKQRIRISLRTKSLSEARQRRDAVFRGLKCGLSLTEACRLALDDGGTSLKEAA